MELGGLSSGDDGGGVISWYEGDCEAGGSPLSGGGDMCGGAVSEPRYIRKQTSSEFVDRPPSLLLSSASDVRIDGIGLGTLGGAILCCS